MQKATRSKTPSPLLYEINTRCWLRDCSDRLGRPITLANVPVEELARWRDLGFTHIWLMGVWTTGPRGRAHSLNDPGLRTQYARILPHFQEDDIAGSPYAVAEYQVPESIGGEAGLKRFRDLLRQYGMKLLLDFVCNHVGLDHPWVTDRPELFVHGREESPGTFPHENSPGEILWLGHGKDPFFPSWIDTAQLDFRRPDTRQAMTEVLRSIASRCDGVRCDMAMLVLNEIFSKNWSQFPCPVPEAKGEFWQDAIRAVRKEHPNFLFLGEVYWNLEAQIAGLGFDYTYDKRLLDLILHHRQETLCYLASAGDEFLSHSAHFLENHDEPRIASRLQLPEHRAAALLTLCLPGMRFLHEGQLTGARHFISVHFARRPAEPAQPDIAQFYDRLLRALPLTAVGNGSFQLLQAKAAWPENPTAKNLILLRWQGTGSSFDLAILNLAPHPSQCRVPLPFPEKAPIAWELKNLLGDEVYIRHVSEMTAPGLFLDLPAYGAQLFHCSPQK